MEESKNTKEVILKAIIGVLIIIVILLLMVGSCDSIQYEVTFDYNNGEGYETINVKENDTIRRPLDPEWEGHTFDNWYFNDKEFDFNTKIDRNLILEARWKDGSSDNNITLDNTEITLLINTKSKINITSLPEGIELSSLVWSSSDEQIVTVDNNGNITAIKEGTATITVKTSDDKYSASVKVTITNNIVDITSLSISGSNSVEVSKAIKLTANIEPSTATNRTLKWSSNNTSIATVDSNGNVKGIKEGKVVITVTSSNGKVTATKEITIVPKKIVKVTSVSISGASEVTVGNTIKLTANVKPTDADNKKVTWSSNNTSIATVDSKGNVKGIKAGTATITVTTEDGKKTATKKITVKAKAIVYKVNLTALVTATGSINQYEVAVTKDGKPFTQYEYILFGSTPVKPGKSTISAALANNGKLTSVKIVIDSKTTVTANITYSSRKFE